MKNIITILLATLLVPTLSAQIEYIDYGVEGWVIPMNANVPLDVNNDGTVDFYLNEKEGELGITPIIHNGCVLGTGSYTSFGTWEIKLMNEGDIVQLLVSDNEFYIEDEPTSIFTTNEANGLADGWVDQEDHYIGIAILGSGFKDGWMKLSIDVEAETLTIKEIAVKDAFSGGIAVGQTEDATNSVNQLDDVLSNVSISPNPANDFIRLTYNYTGTKDLSVTILNNIGQEINRIALGNRSGNLELNTSNWAQGIYFIRFETADGPYTDKVSVIK